MKRPSRPKATRSTSDHSTIIVSPLASAGGDFCFPVTLEKARMLPKWEADFDAPRPRRKSEKVGRDHGALLENPWVRIGKSGVMSLVLMVLSPSHRNSA